MDTKQFFISVSFAIITTMLINYFIVDRFFSIKDTQEIKSGQAFHITPLEQLNKPLNTEVNFLDEDKAFFVKNQSLNTEISTPLMDIFFSSRGGVITDVICKKVNGQVESPLTIISHGTFGLIAGDTYAPLQYVLVNHDHTAGVHTIVYESQSALGVITKEFKVYDTTYSIDLAVTITPSAALTPRIIFPGPYLADTKSSYYDTALVNDQSNGIQRLKPDDSLNKAFALPTLCGISDRYFVTAAIKGGSTFAQRCYFTMSDERFVCIMEGAEIVSPSTWNTSWYCGPKEFEALVARDVRLGELLDYGWFAPIARPMLSTLKIIYNYVHNYGLAIIILTILLNLALLPFTSRGEKSMQKATEFSKKMQYLEQKYKHDKERLAKEKSELMQKHGSVDAIGCLSFGLQMIFFIGLNKVLSSSVELFHAPFYGWITDLSIKDPYYILPFCVFLGIVLPTVNSGNIRQRGTSFAMGLLVLGIMAQLSAGLVLFILTNIVTRVVVTSIKKLL